MSGTIWQFRDLVGDVAELYLTTCGQAYLMATDDGVVLTKEAARELAEALLAEVADGDA